MIVTLLLKKQGFYSILFFVLNHYLYCKKNKLNYRMNTDNWLFKSIYGWMDYFENIELNYDSDISKEIMYYDQVNTLLDSFSLNDYRNAIKEIYLYNDKTRGRINAIKEKYNLCYRRVESTSQLSVGSPYGIHNDSNNNYSSIFIRRGDKLIHESNFYTADIYIEKLLEKEPDCKRIFIQTDDYNCILEAKDYINTNNLNIEIITICDENTKGMVIISHQQQHLFNVLNNYSYSKNKDYLMHNVQNLASFKPVDQMNASEVYEHTIQMLIGIDIVLNSKVCIIDFESNVSRFIKLAHSQPENVFDINNKYIDLNRELFPAYGF
jgi:hypothetical protein